LYNSPNSRVGALFPRGFVVCLSLAVVACATVGKQTEQRFATPEEATGALLDAIESDSRSSLVRVLGSEYRASIVTADWDAERDARREILQGANDIYWLREVSEQEVELVLGVERWPFPIPIVKGEGGWYFDTERGLEEIVDRRIGKNELTAIAISRAYVDAQIAYALADRDGDDWLEYAQRLSSTPGTRDGLYWETSADEAPSPFGPLVTDAERYLSSLGPGDPIRGYYFHILTGQGGNPSGGRYSYIVNGRMVAGFALVAFPAEYRATGAMTFVVSQRGVVYQKDLGDQGVSVEEYDPDDSWSVVTD